MNRDVERLDPRFGLDNLNLDTLTPDELARYRNGTWCKGTKVPASKPKATEHPTMIDAQPYTEIVRALHHQHVTFTAMSACADVGLATIRSLYHGKASVQQATADKLHRLVALLPSERA